MKSLCILLILIFSTSAIADSAQEFTVAVTCDAKHKAFSLDPVIWTEDAGILIYEGNGSELDHDKNLFECKLSKGYVIKLKYHAYAPQMRGMCMGIGFNEINNITVNNSLVYGYEVINSGCFFTEKNTLISLKIYLSKSKIKIRTCRAQDWQTPNYVGRSCSTKNIDLASSKVAD